jgi:hypothetical protein
MHEAATLWVTAELRPQNAGVGKSVDSKSVRSQVVIINSGDLTCLHPENDRCNLFSPIAPRSGTSDGAPRVPLIKFARAAPNIRDRAIRKA